LPARNVPPTSATSSKPAISKPTYPDLITRYNLTARVSSGEDAEIASSGARRHGWSQNKNERQALLQKRREEMILAARRKMQEKVATELAE
jgi:coupling of ubiquitin conjugation to ER degradation protein 1